MSQPKEQEETLMNDIVTQSYIHDHAQRLKMNLNKYKALGAISKQKKLDYQLDVDPSNSPVITKLMKTFECI